MDGHQTTAPLDTTPAPLIIDRRAAAWRAAIILLTVGSAVILLLCRDAVQGAVRVWIESATFNHCFLVVPICLYMIWERRARWQHLAPEPAWAALILLGGVAAVYWVAAVANLLEAQQFATIALIELLILCVLGWRLYAALLLPLLYLFFLVPSGEWLVPWLQDFTAGFVVRALELLGVPVYSDGILISIPASDFQVAEACAGIRFLVASLAFGCLFADLVYVGWRRKALFIALSLVVPIVANGLRALAIVLIAHWTDAAAAVGVDHIVFGWVFFSAVTLVLMAIGWAFRERGAPPRPLAVPNRAVPVGRLIAVGGTAIALAAIAPAHAMLLDRLPARAAPDRLAAPAAPPGWRLEPATGDTWKPVMVGADREVQAIYRAGDRRVHLSVAFYARERAGAKAVSSVNRIADETTWQRLSTEPTTVTIDGHAITVPASRLASGAARRLAWQWYWIGGEVTSSALRAKFLQLDAALRGGSRSAAVIALAAPYDGDPDQAAVTLAAFLAARPDIAGALRRASMAGGG